MIHPTFMISDALKMLIVAHMLTTFLCVGFTACTSSGSLQSDDSGQKVLESFLDSTFAQNQPAVKPRAVPTPAVTRPPMRQAEGVVSVGDSISVSVWGYPEFATRTIVKVSGSIVVPLVGEIQILGLTTQRLQELVKERLSEYIQGDIRLTVEVIPPMPRIIIIGSVTRPGNYPFAKEASLIDVLSLAGGWTQGADLERVRIIRKAGVGDPLIVNLVNKIEENDVYSIPVIYPGDAIIVPGREDFLAESAGFFGAVFGTLILLGILSGFQ